MANKCKKLDPIDRDIIRLLKPLKLAVTPAKIASKINVHPSTVQRRLKNLDDCNITKCVKRGNRTYCKLQKTARSKDNLKD